MNYTADVTGGVTRRSERVQTIVRTKTFSEQNSNYSAVLYMAYKVFYLSALAFLW